MSAATQIEDSVYAKLLARCLPAHSDEGRTRAQRLSCSSDQSPYVTRRWPTGASAADQGSALRQARVGRAPLAGLLTG